MSTNEKKEKHLSFTEVQCSQKEKQVENMDNDQEKRQQKQGVRKAISNRFKKVFSFKLGKNRVGKCSFV